jgi:RNA polymerase sigma-70 factor, ECF subfamily
MTTSISLLEQANAEGWSDEAIVDRVLQGETELYELIMRRYNQRLYRAAVAILADESEAEDVMQDAYVRAYQHLNQFEGRARFSTWLTRIAVHEALARARKRKGAVSIDETENGIDDFRTTDTHVAQQERQLWQREIGELLQAAMLAVPESYRTVLVLRDLEDMSTSETADVLELTEENVKVRLHRARALLRKELSAAVGPNAPQVFEFMGARCDRVVTRVMERVRSLQGVDEA